MIHNLNELSSSSACWQRAGFARGFVNGSRKTAGMSKHVIAAVRCLNAYGVPETFKMRIDITDVSADKTVVRSGEYIRPLFL